MENEKDHSEEIKDSKNTISNSSIKAGGNVHIGDIINIQQAQQSDSGTDLDKNEVVENIQKLIMENRISEALKEMLNITKGMRGTLPDHTILLTQQWNSLQSDRRVQMISESDATVRANRIIYGLSELVKELGKEI